MDGVQSFQQFPLAGKVFPSTSVEGTSYNSACLQTGVLLTAGVTKYNVKGQSWKQFKNFNINI